MPDLEEFKKEFNPTEDISPEEETSFIKRFAKYFCSLWAKTGAKDNAFFVSEGSDEEEKDAIEDSCQEVDDYYGELAKLHEYEDNYDTDDYLTNRLQEINREDGTEESNEVVSKQLSKHWDAKGVENAEYLFDSVENALNTEKENEQI